MNIYAYINQRSPCDWYFGMGFLAPTRARPEPNDRLSSAEIARAIGVREGTVKRRLKLFTR